MFVDYAGAKIPVYDRRTGEVACEASIFVAVLGASSYTFVEATHSCRVAVLDRFTHPRLEFYGGVPEIAVPTT